MKLNRFLAVFAVLLLVGLPVFAQTTAGLTGTVSLGGNPLPGATVTISSPNLQGVRTAVTDVNGNYNFGGLPPGDYTVKFEMESMQSVTRTTRIGLSSTSRVDAELKLSSVAEAITVTASAPAVLETTEVQTNISANLIENLPIGRTLLATVNLAPGVSTNGPAGATMISGGYAYDSSYYVDGAVVNEVLRGQPQNLFIEDALQETTVQTGAISAEYGRFTGGVVTAISKSGGNEFSGSFRDSLTNPSWTTLGKLDAKTTTPFKYPSDKIQSTYEGTLGGRIVRDRLWFFAAGRIFNLDFQRQFGRTGTSATEPIFTFPFSDHERRMEIKLTGQVTPKHSLVGSYLDIKRDQKNNPFGTPLEASALDASRSLPNSFYTLNYNGVITNNFLVEGTYAKQKFQFVHSGADAPASPATGTNLQYQSGKWAGYPTFCGGCSPFPESRNNQNAKLKGSYFLSTKGLGSHNISVGGEDYKDMLKSDNHQSASDFTIQDFISSDIPTRAADGTLLNNIGTGQAILIYWPILQSSKGNSFNTRSLFANDKWDLNPHLNFNLGVRYDHDSGKNQAGADVAKDSKVSPRLGVNYDVFANGRLRLNASYSQYASKIANGNVGDATSSAGSPSYLYWLYYGPNIVNQPTPVAMKTFFDWFNSVGGIKNTDFLLGGGTAGIQTQIGGELKSPGVDEWTIGAGTQVGANGFLRADYQDRKWNNFYTNVVNTSTGKVFDPLVTDPATGKSGSNVDLALIENSNTFTRQYKAAIVQGGYRLFNRVNLGANYTYATLKGDITGETSGSGPVPAGGPQQYPEFFNYANRNPMGYLGADQRHKVRAWASYDLPTAFGTFNFSWLQRYDSGTPYSAIGNVYVASDAAYSSRCTAARLTTAATGYTGFNPCPTNFGTGKTNYTNLGNGQNSYYFSKRGAYRTDNISASDLAVNYFLPIRNVNLFVEGELINAFNRQGVVNVNTTVLTATSSACTTVAGPAATSVAPGTTIRCLAFNPFTDTPIEGVNWKKGPNFGKPITPTSGAFVGGAGDFQLPRTYRVSFGVKF